LEAAGVGAGEEVVGELGFGGGGEGEGVDGVLAEGALEAGGEVCAETGGINDDGVAGPDVFEEGDEVIALLVEGAAGPPVEVLDTDEGVLVGTERGDLGDGDDGGVFAGVGGAKKGIGGDF